MIHIAKRKIFVLLSFYAALWEALCCCSHEMDAAHEEVGGAGAASREKVLHTTAR